MNSLAHRLVFMVSRSGLSVVEAMEFFAVAAEVRRLEITLDEIEKDARESADLAEAEAIAVSLPPASVVYVDFAKGMPICRVGS